jgi:hypothetical protein
LYKKGNKNSRADILSRKADYIYSKPEPSYTIFDIQGNIIVYNCPEINTISIETNNKTELQAICKVYPRDTAVQQILNNLEKYKIYRITTERTILFEEQVYILKNIKNQVVRTRYSTIPYSYPGIGKILELVSRMFYFPGIRKVVKRIINRYNIYCRNKAARYILYSKLYLLKVPLGV